jgi:hypothetical protein
MNFIDKGCGFWVRLKTNADNLLKELLRPDAAHEFIKPLLIAFLQDESYLELKAKSLDVSSFFPKDSAPPELDIFDSNGPVLQNLLDLKQTAESFKQTPIVMNIIDLFENYLKAKIQLSFHIPNVTLNVNFKTAGIRELYQKITNEELPKANSGGLNVPSGFGGFKFNLFPPREARGLFLGLDASGKTTALYKLKLGEIVSAIPTIGFNVETIDYKKYKMTIWDVGGQPKLRPLWRHYFQNTQFIVYFVTGSIYEARRQILGNTEPPFIAKIPVAYALRSVHGSPPGAQALHQFGNRLNVSPLKPMLLPTSPMSPLLSPSFWPPAPFVGAPFRSPTGKELLTQENLAAPPGFRPKSQMRYSVPSAGGFNRSLFNYSNGLHGLGSPLLQGTSQPDKIDNEHYHHRKAPGFDRPNIAGLVALPETANDSQKASFTNDKKLLAMKAMYQAKTGPRNPNSEWSGYGFSKTQMDLFSKGANSSSNGSNKGIIIEADEGFTSDEMACLSLSSSTSSSAWTTASADHQDTNNNKEIDVGIQAKSPAMNQPEPVTTSSNLLKTPLGPQQSNLFDLTPTTKFSLDLPVNDLPTLFVQNGLEKYIDVFVGEEIDCEAFAVLTENDLRSLGVTSYPARKKMLILIKHLFVQLRRASGTQWD